MIYWHLFLAFFIANILGYGGGPASIPLIQNEVVEKYGWITNQEFSEILAIGNSLPGPIATKMAGYIGYEVGGVFGAVISLFATIAPSLILLIFFLRIIDRFKDSPKVTKMTNYVKPTVGVLLGSMAVSFLLDSYHGIGTFHTVILFLGGLFILTKTKVSPAFVILLSMMYGVVFL